MRSDPMCRLRGFARGMAGMVVAIILLRLSDAGAVVVPAGSKVSAVQFDAIIELNSPQHGSHVLVFTRYWVAPSFYSMGVVWGEPHGNGLDLSVYPPTLTIASDERDFTIAHDIRPECNQSTKKPIAERGAFRCMYGDYPVVNLQFAEQEALTSRVHADRLAQLIQGGGNIEQVLDLPVVKADAKESQIARRARVRAVDGRLSYLELLDSTNKAIKTIDYEYAQDEGRTYLLRQNVRLPERLMEVSLQGEGIIVKVGDNEYKYRDFDAVHHQDGRRCVVEYKPAMLADKRVVVPVCAKVWDGEKKELLRSVRMMNFKPIELDPNGAREAAKRFCGFMKEEVKYRELLINYWQKRPTDVTEADAQTIRQLQSHFQESSAGQDTPGGELKRLNILMELDRMLGDMPKLEEHYQCYLSVLSANELPRMVEAGGHNAIETLVSWGRYSEADALLDPWIKAISTGIENRESLLRFTGRQLQKEHFWSTVKLLERFSATCDQSADDGFEIEGAKCKVLHQLVRLAQGQIKTPTNVAKAQAEWAAASVGQEGLGHLLLRSLAEATRSFDRLTEPTKAQRDLKEQLDKISELMDREVPARPKGDAP